MTIPLLISFVVAGASALFPPKNQPGTTTNRSSSGSTRSLHALPGLVGNQIFLAGVVIGMSFSWFISSELHRSRLHDRIRLYFFGFIRQLSSSSNGDINSSQNLPTETTIQLKDLVAAPSPSSQENNDGQQQDSSSSRTENSAVSTIISPSISLTSSLWVSTIRIPPQQELQIQKANGLEFYYVLQGKGEWDMIRRTKNKGEDGNNTAANGHGRRGKPLVEGDAFVVEANTTRWISNTSSSLTLGGLSSGFCCDLILLRSSDAGVLFGHCQKGYDRVVPARKKETRPTESSLPNNLAAMTQQASHYINSFFTNSEGGTSS